MENKIIFSLNLLVIKFVNKKLEGYSKIMRDWQLEWLFLNGKVQRNSLFCSRCVTSINRYAFLGGISKVKGLTSIVILASGGTLPINDTSG